MSDQFSRAAAIRKVMRIKALSHAKAAKVVDDTLRGIQQQIDKSTAEKRVRVQ